LIYKLFKKFQKFTGTDNVYILKHSLPLGIGSIISIIAAFLLSVFLAWALPKETYGQYRYILSIVSILAISSLQGMNIAIIQAVAKGFDKAFKKGLKTKFKWSLFGSIGSIIVAIYFWSQGNIEFTISFLIIAIFLPLFKGGETYQYYLDGKKLFGKRVTYTTIIQILASVFIVIVLLFTKSLIVLILVYFASYSILRLIFLYITIRKIKPNKKENSKTISYGKHLSVMGVLTIISQQINIILLYSFLGPIQLAIYSFAFLPIEYLRTPLKIIQEIALPKLSTRPKNDIKKTLPKKLVIATLFALIIILIYVLLAPVFFKMFYPQYLDSVSYSRLLSLTLLIFPISIIMISLQAKMKTKELYKINIIHSLIRILFFVILIPFYGIWGLIIAILLSQVICFFMALFYFKKM